MTEQKPAADAAPAVRVPYDAMGPIDAANPPAARATLATVQPGGRVRLGHHHGGEQAEPAAGAFRCVVKHCGSSYARVPADGRCHACGGAVQPSPTGQAVDLGQLWEMAFAQMLENRKANKRDSFLLQCLRKDVLALAAQPSPAGQGDALDLVMGECEQWFDTTDVDMEAAAESIVAALAARQAVAEQHPDDLAVDAFAAAMKAKMAKARAKGRGGWEDPEQCSADDLSRMLRDHVEKGDPRDVANFCMMLHQRGEAIAARQPVGQIVGYMDPNADFMLARPGDCVMMGNIALWREPGGKYTKPLYDAPPAQAVDLDLDRVRATVQTLLNWIDDWAETPEESEIEAIEAEAEAVLAMIDSNASAGEPNAAPNQLTDTAQANLFYIQDTRQFVGNCPMWWGPNGSGYVTRLDEAGRYTEQEAIRQNRTRETDIPWLCSEIDALARRTVDCQHMRPRSERLAELALIGGKAVGNG